MNNLLGSVYILYNLVYLLVYIWGWGFVIFSWYCNLLELFGPSEALWLVLFLSSNLYIFVLISIIFVFFRVNTDFLRWWYTGWPVVGNVQSILYQLCWPYVLRPLSYYQQCLLGSWLPRVLPSKLRHLSRMISLELERLKENKENEFHSD